MATKPLLESFIEKGRILLDRLRDAQFPMSGMMWGLIEGESEFRLMIATPLVDKMGARAVYRLLSEVETSIPQEERLPRFTTMAVSENHRFFRGLREKTAESGELGEGWIYALTGMGPSFADGYLYFVSDKVKLPPQKKAS